MITEKICPKCQETKLASQFYQVKSRADGLSGYCRTCQLRDVKERYSPHPRWRAPEGQKYCPTCKEVKPLDAFGANKSQFDGKQSKCKPCAVAAVTASRQKDPTSHRRSSKAWREKNAERNSDNSAKWNYGLDHGDYALMLELQNGRCAICKTDNPGSRLNRFHIDHDHTKGKGNSDAVRGLLCENCNRGLGLFKDDPELLIEGAAYIKRARQ